MYFFISVVTLSGVKKSSQCACHNLESVVLKTEYSRARTFTATPLSSVRYPRLPTSTRGDLSSELRLLEVSGACEGPETPQIFAGVDERAPTRLELWASVLENALSTEKISPELTALCLQAPAQEAVRQILQALLRESQTDKRDGLAVLLEACLRESLGTMLIKQCRAWHQNFDEEWTQIVQLIISLPTRVANKMQELLPDFCDPEKYSEILVFQIASTLKFLAEADRHDVEWKVDDLAHFLDKVLTNYGGCKSVEVLMQILVLACEKDEHLHKVVRSTLLTLEDKACENAITLMILSKPIGSLVGTEVPNVWKRTMLSIIPFLRCHNNTEVAKNLIKSVAVALPRSDLVELLVKLVSVWSNRSAIAHTSLEQQTYISEMILCCISQLHSEDLQPNMLSLQRTLGDGTTKHLESTSTEIRLIGMLVSEKLSALLHPKAEPLKFEYNEQSELCKHLRGLSLISEEKSFTGDWFEELTTKLKHEEMRVVLPPPRIKLESSVVPKVVATTMPVLDSDDEDDDEFEAYDMSADVPVSQKEKPAYLREALQLFAEKPDEVCITGLAELISKQLPGDDASLAVELLEGLLHLEVDEESEAVRGKCLIATVIANPEETTKHLCHQLTLPNKFSYSHSSSILRVLALAALEMFQGKKEIENLKIEVPALQKNTRRFHSYRPPVKETRSKFSSVAGFFLYPLLPCLYCDWFAELKCQLLATLGTVVACSVHAPNVRKISLALLEELVVARWPASHVDPEVRVAATRAVVAALANLDMQGVFECGQREELRDWMRKAVRNDPDEGCREWAGKALSLLQ